MSDKPEGTKFKLDYLSVTLFRETVSGEKSNYTEVLETVCEVFGISNTFESLGFGGRAYADIRIHPEVDGLTAYLYPKTGHHLHLELKGTACSVIGEESIGRLGDALAAIDVRARASRVDIACDHVGFTPNDLHARWKGNHVRTRFRKYDYRTNAEGDTFYVGSKDSIQLCCYNKRGFTRAEIRCYADVADIMGIMVMRGSFGDAAQASVGTLTHRLTFLEEDGSPMASWADYAALGCQTPAKLPARSRDMAPAQRKVVFYKDRLQNLLGEVAIISLAFGHPPELIAEMIAQFKLDDASRPLFDRIKRVVDQL